MSFEHFGLEAELLRAVREQGYNEPTPIQARAIPAILDGRDLMAGAQTGTGKTAGPNLINTTRINAEDVLNSNGLKLGEIEYVESLELNAVLFQKIDGEDVASGAFVPKGSKIDLIIGDGLGNISFETPDFTGQSLDEVRFQISASKLILDIINYVPNDTLPANLRNRIYHQLPPAGRKTSSGGNIEIWINREPPKEDGNGEIEMN